MKHLCLITTNGEPSILMLYKNGSQAKKDVKRWNIPSIMKRGDFCRKLSATENARMLSHVINSLDMIDSAWKSCEWHSIALELDDEFSPFSHLVPLLNNL